MLCVVPVWIGAHVVLVEVLDNEFLSDTVAS